MTNRIKVAIQGLRRPSVAWLLAATVLPLANALLCQAVRNLPLFMDSIFTAVAAAILGPLPALLVAVLTNAWIEAFNGFKGQHLPFALCGMSTAAIVAGFVSTRRYWTPVMVVTCIVSVMLANSVLGAIIATFVYGGGTGVKIDTIASGFSLVADSIFSAAFLARAPINLIDKSIAVFPALALAAYLGAGEKHARFD